MLLDKELVFSQDQAITATADSTNVVDLVKARDIGNGKDLFVMVQVTEAFTDADSNSTVTVNLVTDDNESLSTDTVVQALVTLPALSAKGTTLYFRIHPENLVAFERYVGLAYVVANGNLTTGKITAAIVMDIQKNKHYPAGFTIA